METRAGKEFVDTPRIDWRIGPFHAHLPGAFRLSLRLDGEVIDSAAVEKGFAYRGLEKLLCRMTWLQGVALMDKLDPEAAIFGEWAYCLAVEKAHGISLPERALAIRVLLAELSRVSAHLKQLATVGLAAGSESVFHFMLREREHVLDLLELVTGSRHSPVYFRPGGVKQDVSEGFLERLQGVGQRILDRISEYNDQLTYNEAFVRRVSGRGVISRDMVLQYGISGIPAKAFDPSVDLRWQGFPGYESIQHHELQYGRTATISGDLHHRFVLKLQEIIQSAHLLQELAQHMPVGEFCQKGVFSVMPTGTFTAQVEAPRGRLTLALTSSGGTGPDKVEFKTPSEPLFSALPAFLSGVAMEDLPLALASVDLEIAEVDR